MIVSYYIRWLLSSASGQWTYCIHPLYFVACWCILCLHHC